MKRFFREKRNVSHESLDSLTHSEAALCFVSGPGRHVSVSAEPCGLVQGGCWDSYGEEIQLCAVWRFVGLFTFLKHENDEFNVLEFALQV